MKEFKINEFITLKLESGNTNITVNGKLFDQCKYLMLNIPIEETEIFDEIESIDEAADMLGWTEHGQEGVEYGIDPETEFWGHCSNLQAWYEHEYNTRLLHRNLAFPLLRRLTDCGDPLAKKVFKEEIAKRLESGFSPVVSYLMKEGYLNYFNSEELNVLMTKDKIWQGVLTMVETISNVWDKPDAFSTLLSAIKGADLMREKFADLLTAVETIPGYEDKPDAFSILLSAIKGTDLMDAFSLRVETTFSKLLAAVESMPDDRDKYYAFRALLSAIKGTDLMDAFSSRIEKLKNLVL